MPNREKVMEALEKCSFRMMCYQCPYRSPNDSRCQRELMYDAIALLKEQEDSIRILTSDLEDLQKEHEKLLDKKIPLITNGQEVVRCKDCKHGRKSIKRMINDEQFYWCKWSKGLRDGVWFCADGKKKSREVEKKR